MNQKKITVIGGVNMDIGGRPDRPLIGADSNPGTVSSSMGGVGRNIAHNLRLLHQPVSMITVFGEDQNGAAIRRSMSELGIDIGSAKTIPGAATSTYLFITDEQGEMKLAVADTRICEQMTPAFMEERLSVINDSSLCIIDTNLPAETIQFLAENITVPLFADPVSTTKMHKLTPILHRIHTLKPNRLEAELLSGIAITGEESLKKAAKGLLELGIQRIFISLGANGVYCAEGEQSLLLPGIPTRVRNTTGGGDCFMAALAFAYRAEMDLQQSASFALAAGAICTEGDNTINEALNEDLVFQRAGLEKNITY